MENNNPHPTSPSSSRPRRIQERRRSGPSDTDKREHVFIAQIRATDVVSSLRRLPAGFYIVVQADGRITRSSNKPVLVGKDMVEWDEEILLPSERSSSISFAVYASFELGPGFWNGEILHRFKITVGDILDHDEKLQAVQLPIRRDEVFPSCSSLRIITERRVCDVRESITALHPPESDVINQLEWLTDIGNRALVHYRQLQIQRDLDEAIECFERAQDTCPADHPNRSTVLFNLANAKFIDCQANDRSFDLHVPITLYQDVLQLRADGHPDHCITALHLGFALLTRSQRQGNEGDMTEAKNLLCRVMELSQAESYTYRAAHLALEMAEIPVSPRTVRPEIPDPRHTNPDDEEPIRSARATLLDLSESDPDRPALLAYLGSLLCARFQSNDKLVHIQEAVFMLGQAVQLTSDEHPQKPALLYFLGDALSRRFQRLGDTLDLDQSISMLEEAISFPLSDQSDKPAWMNTLGDSLLRRFERLGDLVDIEKSVFMIGEAVRLAPDGHPDKPAFLNNLSQSLLRRFQRLGDIADITKSTLMTEKAVHLAPDGHPKKEIWLKDLVDLLSQLLEQPGDLGDHEMFISMFEKAVSLTAVDDPNKPVWLNNLGSLLLRRFGRLSSPADLDKSISMFEEAVHLIPDDHPDKPAAMDNLGRSLLRRYQCVGELVDLNQAILKKKEAVRLTPSNHPFLPARLITLANSLLHRFGSTGDLADINTSISTSEEALRLIPSDDPGKPLWLNSLGSSLLRRFERFGRPQDIDQSISILDEAVKLAPNGHRARPSYLNNLGCSLSCRFEHSSDIADIDRSISLTEEAIALTPSGHPDELPRLNNLAGSLLRRYEHLGDLADIDKSISLFVKVVDLTPPRDHSKPSRLNNLGNSLFHRFQLLGDLADINKSILVKEEALRLIPSDHPDKPVWLNDLGSSLLSRFKRLGDVPDIDESISLKEKAVNLIPDDHTNKPVILDNLGNSLLSRFQHLGNLEDINKSILMQERAIHLSSDRYPRSPALLSHLGCSLTSRFDKTGDPTDIDKSISVSKEAVDLAADGHPNKTAWLYNLGIAFMWRFKRFHERSDLSAAILYFSEATCTPTGSTSTRFLAVRQWISSARLEGNSQAILNAYTTAIDLLPQLAWLGLPLAERHRMLLDAADIARDAAAAALEAGFPDKAVEWLEQGRSIVWNQLLQLRSPVDELGVKHPELARRFQQVSKQLEDSSSRSSNFTASADARSLEEEVQKHHDLALRREKLLAEIRSLPGFDRFLLPKLVKQLATLAKSGPVVYLNASQQRCDALIINAESASVVPVPLPGVRYRGLERVLCLLLKRDHPIVSRNDISALIPSEEDSALQSSLRTLLMADDAIEGGGDREGGRKVEEYTPDDRFREILEFLWERVVGPVLGALGILAGARKMFRIFWCPTGPFAFLPIHAASLYGTALEDGKLSDVAISSYIPTLSALSSSVEEDTNGPSSSVRLIAVPQPQGDGQIKLRGVKKEIDSIRSLSTSSRFVTMQDSHGTVEDVMAKITNADWVHVACHGVQDPHNPLNSGLCLADRRRLKLSDIIRLSRPQGGLAFLSACQTAHGDERLPEESVHLAAGMLLAGYGSVIATMWSIMDRDAPQVAKDVYAYLFRDGKVPDSTEAAEALHYAVLRLRDNEASFTSWVPFIHIGR